MRTIESHGWVDYKTQPCQMVKHPKYYRSKPHYPSNPLKVNNLLLAHGDKDSTWRFWKSSRMPRNHVIQQHISYLPNQIYALFIYYSNKNIHNFTKNITNLSHWQSLVYATFAITHKVVKPNMSLCILLTLYQPPWSEYKLYSSILVAFEVRTTHHLHNSTYH